MMHPSAPRKPGAASMQEYVPLDDSSAPPSSVWKMLILVLTCFVFLSSMWVFSEMPGSLTINGEPAWSSNQTWHAAIHFCVVAVVALLVWLKR